MSEHEQKMSFELRMPVSLFEKLEAVREGTSEGELEFYTDAIVKGTVIKGLEKVGLFVMAVDEERDAMEFLDTHQDTFEQAATPDQAVSSLEPKIRQFGPRQ